MSKSALCVAKFPRRAVITPIPVFWFAFKIPTYDLSSSSDEAQAALKSNTVVKADS